MNMEFYVLMNNSKHRSWDLSY